MTIELVAHTAGYEVSGALANRLSWLATKDKLIAQSDGKTDVRTYGPKGSRPKPIEKPQPEKSSKSKADKAKPRAKAQTKSIRRSGKANGPRTADGKQREVVVRQDDSIKKAPVTT